MIFPQFWWVEESFYVQSTESQHFLPRSDARVTIAKESSSNTKAKPNMQKVHLMSNGFHKAIKLNCSMVYSISIKIKENP